MRWSNPESVNLGTRTVNIRNRCDYRVVLDAIEALTCEDMLSHDRYGAALRIFYEDKIFPEEAEKAISEMLIIIGGEQKETSSHNSPKLMDWQKDFHLIAPPISRVLGYDVRDPRIFTHWNAFTGAYMEIGECYFQSIVNIRRKRAEGKPLDKYEIEFFMKNQSDILFDTELSEEDELFLKGG